VTEAEVGKELVCLALDKQNLIVITLELLWFLSSALLHL
jgi:hypothetical protein